MHHQVPRERLAIFIEEEEKHDEVFIKVMSVIVDGNTTLVSNSSVPSLDGNRLVNIINAIEKNEEEASGGFEEEEDEEVDGVEVVGGDALESKGGWEGGLYTPDYDYHGVEGGFSADICPYPTYYSYFTVLILLGATLLAQVTITLAKNSEILHGYLTRVIIYNMFE